MRLKFLLVLIFLSTNSNLILAQRQIDAGFIMGASSYLGDLTVSYTNIKNLHPGGGIFGRYTFANGFFSLKAALMYGTISGSDKDNIATSNLYKRNLNFKSPIQEISTMGEFNLFALNPCKHRYFTLYGTAGLALFRFDPQTTYQGQVIHLQKIGTEGQGIPLYPEKQKYDLVQLSVPFGAGAKIVVRSRVILSVEFIARKTFTDYLDDVSTNYIDPKILAEYNGEIAAALAIRSGDANQTQYIVNEGQRGNSKNKDWYYFGTFSMSYIFKSDCTNRFDRTKESTYLRQRYDAYTPINRKGTRRKLPIISRIIDCYKY